MQIRARQGDTLDAICWRYYGRTAGCVEALLDANQGIASHGPVLPMGTLVTLPDTPPAQTDKTNTVKLWS